MSHFNLQHAIQQNQNDSSITKSNSKSAISIAVQDNNSQMKFISAKTTMATICLI